MFKAGSAYIEVSAETKKAQRDLKALTARMERLTEEAGFKSGKAFERSFKAQETIRNIAADMKAKSRTAMLATGRAMGVALKSGIAAAGVASVVGVIGKAALQSASDMKLLADQSGVTAERFQELAYASQRFGFEQKDLRDLLVDMNDRIGDYAATGAGPLADFFENIAPKVGLTIDGFRELSSDRALGLYIRALEEAGANSQDFAFYMEALSSRSTDLVPLFRDNGRELNRLATEARDAGAVLSNDMAQGAFDANAEMERLGTIVRTGVTRAIVEAAPEIEDLTTKIIGMVPTLIGWADTVVDGFSAIGDGIERVQMAWNASIFGKGEAAPMPATRAGLQKRLSRLGRGLELSEQLAEDRKTLRGQIAKRLSTGDEKVFKQSMEWIFGEDRLKEIRKSGRDFRDVLREEYNKTADQLKRLQSRPASGRSRADNGGSSSTVAGRSSGIRARSPSSRSPGLSMDALGIADSLSQVRNDLSEINRLKDDAKTALQDYSDTLTVINSGEKLGMLTAVDASRLRADAIAELGQQTGQLEVAYERLGEAVTRQQINDEDAARTMAVLKEETQAALDAEIEKRAKVIDQLLLETERKRELAALAGDQAQIEALDREILKLRERARLIEAGATDAEALAGAEDYAVQVDEATLEGQHRDAFRNGVQGALGELGPTLDGLFDAPISKLADALFNLIDAFSDKGSVSGGGILGLLRSFDGGGFTGFGPRAGGIDGKGGFPAIVHPNETIIDHNEMVGRFAAPLHAQIKDTPPIRLHVTAEEGPMFRPVIRGEAVEVTNAIAPAHAQAVVGQAGRNATQRQRRQL